MASKPALPNLTTIRLFAAIYVFCFHFIETPLFSLGLTGVNLFFILSGFILAYNYPGVTSPRKFYALRFARIYPLYFIAIVMGLPIFFHTIIHRDATAIWALPLTFTMMQTWWPPLRMAINPAAWTLSVEVFFYLCFPALILWAERRVHHWKQWVLVCCVLLVAPTALYCFVLRPRFPAYDNVMSLILTLPVFHLCEFIAGIFLGTRYRKTRPVFKGWHVTLAALFLVVCLAAASHIPWYNRRLFDDGLLTLPYGILLYTLAGWQSRWFSHPLLQLGGEISYGVYLLQFPTVAVLRTGLRHAPPVYLLAPATLIAAYLGYRFIEKPMRIILLGWLGYHPSQKPIPTPGLQV
jgi:peptidoglycan/LPS O-acetylase OafA/YrhL